MSIDTLEYVKKLESAGIERRVPRRKLQNLGRIDWRVGASNPCRHTVQRIEATVWKAAFAVLGGGLAIGGFLIRFLR